MKYSTTQIFLYTISLRTRMHSSRMCTARLLPVSPSMHCSRGSCSWSGGVYLVLGGTWSGGCTWSQGVFPVWGVYLVRGYLVLGRGVPGPSGVYLVPGGVPGLGGVPGPGSGVPAQVLPPCGQNDRHV